MSRVDLLPAEYRRERTRSALARRLRLLGLCLIGLLAGVYGVRSFEVIGLRSDLRDLEAQSLSVQSSIDALGDVAAQRDAVAYGQSVVDSLSAGEIAWSQQFLRLSSTVPSGFTLSSLSGQSADSGGVIIGSISFSATSNGFVPTEQWLMALDDQPGWVNGWIGTLTGTPESGFTVSGTIDLTADALALPGGDA